MWFEIWTFLGTTGFWEAFAGGLVSSLGALGIAALIYTWTRKDQTELLKEERELDAVDTIQGAVLRVMDTPAAVVTADLLDGLVTIVYDVVGQIRHEKTRISVGHLASVTRAWLRTGNQSDPASLNELLHFISQIHLGLRSFRDGDKRWSYPEMPNWALELPPPPPPLSTVTGGP